MLIAQHVTNYKVKIDTIIYELKEDGLLNTSTNTYAKISSGCIVNKRRKNFQEQSSTERFKIKVAINTTLIRSSAKGKVVSFKKKNNKWKRSRQKLAVFVGGNIYDGKCGDSFQLSQREPMPSGFKKRKQLKVKEDIVGQVWQTKWDELGASYDNNGGYSGAITLSE